MRQAWGTGLQRIKNLAEEYGLPDVEFIEMPDSFRVNLYRKMMTIEDRQNIGRKKAASSARSGIRKHGHPC